MRTTADASMLPKVRAGGRFVAVRPSGTTSGWPYPSTSDLTGVNAQRWRQLQTAQGLVTLDRAAGLLSLRCGRLRQGAEDACAGRCAAVMEDRACASALLGRSGREPRSRLRAVSVGNPGRRAGFACRGS
jgi:hypothetical protein